jgi:DNA-directed RNA polymerase specialized sigma24 family protein
VPDRDPFPPDDPGSHAPTRTGRRELPGQAHSVDDATDLEPPVPARPATPAPTEGGDEAIASRATSEEARDLLALRRAKAGDDASFAALLRANDATLRAFTVALIGTEAMDRVVRDAYVKAYRALDLAPDRDPRLWLLRVAGTACFDEQRRQTRPSRSRARSAAHGDGEPTPELAPVPAELPDEQRVALALVDAAGLTIREAARVTERIPDRLRDDLHAARDATAGVALLRPEAAPTHGADFWNDVARRLLVARETPSTRLDPVDERSAAIGYALPTLSTPAPDQPRSGPSQASPRQQPRRRSPGTGPVGNRSSEAARAAQAAHAPGATPSAPRPVAVPPSPRAEQAARGMATRVRQTRTRNVPWGRIVAIGAVVVVMLIAVLVVVTLASRATNRDARLGLTTDKVLNRLDDNLSADRTVTGTLRVTAPGRVAEPTTGRYIFIHVSDGSYRLTAADGHWDEAYDASAGTFEVRGSTGPKGAATATKVSLTGLAPGPPDHSAFDARATGDPLAATLRLLHEGTGRQVTTSELLPAGTTDTSQATAVWVITAHLPRSSAASLHPLLAGVGSLATDPAGDEVRVVVDQSLLLPLRLQVLHAGASVIDVRLGSLAVNDPLPAGSLRVGGAALTATRDLGFRATALDAAQAVVGYQPLTPAFVPDGYVLTDVAVRAAAPAGVRSTAGGTNPPDVDVVSLTYRRGSLSLTVTTRRTGASAKAWHDPFAPATSAGGTGSAARTDPVATHLGSGAFAGTTARGGSSPLPHLWAVDDQYVLTVAGDLGASELHTVAASMH